MSNIKLQNVRLSFPSLFQTAEFAGDDTGKYEATFILDKDEHNDVIEQINSEMERMQKEDLKSKLKSDKLALKNGDDMARPEFEGKMTIKASTKKRPLVIDRDKTPLTQDDNKPYAGSYVNAIVRLWAQDNQYGKRVNASLEGVQFFGDGEPFGAGGISVNEFDDFEDADDPFGIR